MPLSRVPKSIFLWIIFALLLIDAAALHNGYNTHMTVAYTVPKVLLVGFAPFDGRAENASWEAIENWESRDNSNREFSYHTLRLPVDASKSASLLKKALADWQPNVVLLFAEHETTDAIRIETLARGDDGTMLETRLPATELKHAYEEAGIKAVLSDHAGKFVSNYSFYYLLKYLKDTKQDSVIAGEIHVPLANGEDFSKKVLGDVVEITLRQVTR